MSHSKKNVNVLRFAFCNIILGLLVFAFSLIILRSPLYALIFMAAISTLISLNLFNINKKSLLATLSTPFVITEDNKDKIINKRIEKKDFTISKALLTLSLSVFVYYAVSVLFGAPLFETYGATLYFSILMTLLTVYPLVWYFFFTDSVTASLKVLTDAKLDHSTESQLHAMLVGTVVGAWIGAFPIPLDWDRPWQAWPIPCSIGATIGNSAIHFVIAFRLISGYFKDKKKTLLNRSV